MTTLIEKAVKGNKKARTELYHRYAPRVHLLCSLLLNNSVKADFITVNVFSDIWSRSAVQGIDEEEFLKLVMMCTAVSCRDAVFKDGIPYDTDKNQLKKLVPFEHENREFEGDAELCLAALKEILASFEEYQRFFLILTVLGGFSLKQTAAVMGEKEGAVKAYYEYSASVLHLLIKRKSIPFLEIETAASLFDKAAVVHTLPESVNITALREIEKNSAPVISKKRIIGIISIAVCAAIIAGAASVALKKTADKKLEANLNDLEWLASNINITSDNSFGENIYSISKHEQIPVFDMNYQSIADEEISTMLSQKEYSFEEPFIVVNPYGTNNLGVNIYFTTDTAAKISYAVTVDDESIGDFSRALENGSASGYATEHSYQLIGFVPGYVNNVFITSTDESGETSESTFTVDMSDITVNAETVLEAEAGSSSEELTEGLYVLFGLDKAFKANNYVYDNNGVIRADLVLEDYRSDRIVFHDDSLYYSYNNDGIAKINRLGKIERKYELEGYEMHHDYVLDEYNNKFLVLVNSDEESDETIEDLIISVDIDTGEISQVVDMKKLLPDIYSTAEMPESGQNTYGGTGLDWIHLNSLSVVGENGDIVVSGREISTVIYLENIYEEPSVKYLISEKEVYEGTAYEDMVYEKVGDFVAQAGQHTITYVEDDSLSEGQYYLEMYNNNYGASNTRDVFPWDIYEGVGTFAEGEASKYYRYLVDENAKTFTLVKSFDLPYSSIVSSIQDVGESFVTSSGKSNCFNEYDSTGALIKQFNYTAEKYAYRVFKYDFCGIWFAD